MLQLSDHVLRLVARMAASFTVVGVAGIDDYVVRNRRRQRPQKAV